MRMAACRPGVDAGFVGCDDRKLKSAVESFAKTFRLSGIGEPLAK